MANTYRQNFAENFGRRLAESISLKDLNDAQIGQIIRSFVYAITSEGAAQYDLVTKARKAYDATRERMYSGLYQRISAT